MRCLYCGKELALLKRLTGGGDFCSDAHKQSYQEEYNRLALSRLLQAQKKGQPANPPVQNAPPPPKASVAVEEPPPQVEPRHAANTVSASSDREEALAEDDTETLAEPESAADQVAKEDLPEPVVEPEAEPEPQETAGFLFDHPAMAPLPDQTPYVESWVEPSAGPAMSDWLFQSGAFTLSPADLVSLDLRAKAAPIKEQTLIADSSPQAFTSAPSDSTMSGLVKTEKIAKANSLIVGGAIDINIQPSMGAYAADPGPLHAVAFESTVSFDDSSLLELSPTDIDFPGEDADVLPASRTPNSSETPAPEAGAENLGPRASLEALSRLHQELREHETPQTELAPAGPHNGSIEAAPAEDINTVQEAVVTPDAMPDASPLAELEAAQKSSEEPQPSGEAGEPVRETEKPKFATELFELSIRTFPPVKPALVSGQPHPSNTAALLPNLRSLPLRPKVALATGYVPPSTGPAPSEAKPPARSTTAERTAGPSKQTSSGKPSARLTQPRQPPASAKPVGPASAKAAETSTPAPAKSTAPKPDAAKQDVNPTVSQPAVHEPNPARAASPEVISKPRSGEKEPGSKPGSSTEAGKPAKPADVVKPAAAAAKSATDVVKPAADTKKPAANRVKPATDEPKQDDVPHFGIAPPAGAAGFGSLKVKLGLAIVILVIACVYFLGWGGSKTNKSVSANPAASADGAGPSIILGEGGWVEGWGGDPAGIHAGRQITIYRPSLKLSDYRLEFQGTIDAKSLGWVFRAADPDNYYAMKLMTVGSGLSTKVALFKYLVANGRQTQVGRVPIDLPVQTDTAFAVRLDIRGPQFTTYIQGQQVDTWTDDQLKIGGAGFLNEREERGKVKSVSIRYLSGAAK